MSRPETPDYLYDEMKIAILNHYERLAPRVDLEASALSEAGHTVTVVGWNRKLDGPLPDHLNAYPVRWVSIKAPSGSKDILLVIPRVYQAMWKAFKQVDCDVIHCTHFLLLPIAILIAKQKRCKLVYDAYERYAIDIADYYFSQHQDKVRIIIETIENLLARQVDGILTISSPEEFLKKRYANFCQDVEVLYNVPPNKLPIDEVEIKKLKDKYRGRLVITYVGDLIKDKGILKLLEILDSLKNEFPNILMLFIGKFDSPAQKEAFFELIKQMQLQSLVEFLPFMSYNEMLQYLKISHIGMALHQPEERFKLVGKGTSRKIFTYMHVGLPIISTNLGELGRVVAEEECGLLVDTTSSAEVLAALRLLLKDRATARRMGDNARRAIVEKYNWEAEKGKLFKVYERLGLA